MASISTLAPSGKDFTAKQARAGGSEVKYRPAQWHGDPGSPVIQSKPNAMQTLEDMLISLSRGSLNDSSLHSCLTSAYEQM